MQSWERFAKLFIQRGKPVILVDLPGTGEADPLPLGFDQHFLADVLKATLDDARISRVSIGAASYGTATAYCFAQRYPERVRNLVLGGTMKEIPSHLRSGVAHTLIPLREGRMDQFANEVLGISGPQKGNGLLCTDPTKTVARQKLARRLLYAQLANMKAADCQKYELNTLRLLHHGRINLEQPPRCPTLVFTGEHDSFTLPTYCKEIAKALPSCTYTTIKNSDHLFHIEQFETTADLFYRFSYDLAISDIPQLNAIEQIGSCIDRTNTSPHKTATSLGLSHAEDSALAA
jgi:pimeloyl-ACP methyl ester carboxylesterase